MLERNQNRPKQNLNYTAFTIRAPRILSCTILSNGTRQSASLQKQVDRQLLTAALDDRRASFGGPPNLSRNHIIRRPTEEHVSDICQSRVESPRHASAAVQEQQPRVGGTPTPLTTQQIRRPFHEPVMMPHSPGQTPPCIYPLLYSTGSTLSAAR